VPFRIGVMQLTMEPLDEMLESARVMDEAGMDTSGWPRRTRGGEAPDGGALVDRRLGADGARDGAADDRLGIISPFTRHPVQVAMDARVVQEAAGRGRFILGFGTSKIFLNNARMQTKKTLGPMRDAVEIVRGVPRGRGLRVRGRHVERVRAGARRGAHAARRAAGLRRRDRAEDAGARRRDRGRLPDAVDHDARLRPLHARERRRGHRHRLHRRRLDRRGPRQGRDGAREIAGMYLANKVQNIQGAADTLLDLAGLEQDEIRPVAEAMEQGGRLAAKAR
jgi:hypothetical protein